MFKAAVAFPVGKIQEALKRMVEIERGRLKCCLFKT